MASPSSRQATLPGLPPQDPRERSADHRDRRRDALAFRSPDLELSAPQALDLEADVLQALGAPLAGVASLLAGARAPEHWRAALRGERHVWLVDLCRLATDPSREARDAAGAAVGVLLGTFEARPTTGTLTQRVTETSIAATALLADLALAKEDGAIDESERASLVRRLDVTERAARDARALLTGDRR